MAADLTVAVASTEAAGAKDVPDTAARTTRLASAEGVPDAERRRFLDARDGDKEDGSRMLSLHLAWRAATLPLPAGAPRLGAGLPSMIVRDGAARSGHRILVMMAAMYDPALGDVDTYSNAIAAKMDEILDRSQSEKIVILADVRGGEGWANPAATSVVPFLRAVSAVMSANFPERLHQLVVFPVPWVASALWSVVKQFLDPLTARKVVLLSGPADRAAPVPASLAEYLDEDTLALIRRHRDEALQGA